MNGFKKKKSSLFRNLNFMKAAVPFFRPYRGLWRLYVTMSLLHPDFNREKTDGLTIVLKFGVLVLWGSTFQFRAGI